MKLLQNNQWLIYVALLAVAIAAYFTYRKIDAARMLAENELRDKDNNFVLPDGTMDYTRRRDGTYKLLY